MAPICSRGLNRTLFRNPEQRYPELGEHALAVKGDLGASPANLISLTTTSARQARVIPIARYLLTRHLSFPEGMRPRLRCPGTRWLQR